MAENHSGAGALGGGTAQGRKRHEVPRVTRLGSFLDLTAGGGKKGHLDDGKTRIWD